MKNVILKKFFIISILSIFISCNNDDDSSSSTTSSTSFSVNGETYNLVSDTNSASIITFEDTSNKTSSSTISIVGIQGSTKTATVSFNITYNTSEGISGTYTANEDTVPNTYLQHLSLLQLATISSSSIESITTNNPTGNVIITDNGNNNYNLKYSVTYDDGTTSEADLTTTFSTNTTSL